MKISILGCGWLGLPLSKHLIEKNHTIHGSTTSPDKIERIRTLGIKPYLINLNPEPENPAQLNPFFNTDILVLNVPPGRRRDNVIDFHTRQIQSIIDPISKSTIRFVVFISSTSVYPKNPGMVSEDDTIPGQAGRNSGNALLQTEQLLMQAPQFETTIIRFGGLYGGDRHPAKYLAGRKNMGRANVPVNLIHRDDCIAIIMQIIEENITGEVFNAVADAHPTRKEYYTDAAKKLGMELPSFSEDEPDKNHKIVSNQKLKERLSYQFIYPELKLA